MKVYQFEYSTPFFKSFESFCEFTEAKDIDGKPRHNFMRLQDELAGTENRIAVERRKYNEAVQKYNTSIELFPNNIAASLFGFQRNDAYFKTDPGSRQAPKVDFNKK